MRHCVFASSCRRLLMVPPGAFFGCVDMWMYGYLDLQWRHLSFRMA
ncbi:hypothetical protein [Herbaspirillum sp. SJZ099]